MYHIPLLAQWEDTRASGRAKRSLAKRSLAKRSLAKPSQA